MSPKMPRVTASQVIRVLEKLDFKFTRQSGSHKIYRDDSNNRVIDQIQFETDQIQCLFMQAKFYIQEF